MFIDALLESDQITVGPSTVSFRLPEDFPVVDLSGLGLYCSGELFAGKLYVHCDTFHFVRALSCVGLEPSKVVRKRVSAKNKTASSR